MPLYKTILNSMNKEVAVKRLDKYNSKYYVSEDGDVYTLNIVKQTDCCGFKIHFSLKKLKLTISNKGYSYAKLYDLNHKKYISYRVDMLIAEAFDIPHKMGCHILDHINGVSTENQVTNLAWI